MTLKEKDLTFMEAAAIVAGYGVGSGIMAVPYLASLAGPGALLGATVLGYGLSLLLHLMIAEMMFRDEGCAQLVEILGKYLFRGRWGPFFTWTFFGLILLAFFGTLTGYLAGGGEILVELTGLPMKLGDTIFYLLASILVLYGLKAVGISEKYAVLVMAAVVLILVAASLGRPWRLELSAYGGAKKSLALFGMIMFCFYSLFSIPQAVRGLAWNQRLVPWAVAVGLGFNLVFTLVIALAAMSVSTEVTRIAMLGWGDALGAWAKIPGAVFVLLALLTSFWSISLALSVILQERLKWNNKLAWLAATLPSFLMALTGYTDFLGYLRLTGGLVAVLVALTLVPAYSIIRGRGVKKNPAWSLGSLGSWPVLGLVLLGYLLSVVGSALPIDQP
ncbi:MAG: aromatic amino acid transport family protein [Thermodesulfobacteriota bacterium]